MSESEKPFACPSPGCNMSFVNEDHLTVHRKKHDMILNLGSNGKGNVFVGRGLIFKILSYHGAGETLPKIKEFRKFVESLNNYSDPMEINFHIYSASRNLADQTPTPTRFIRNCEEVGLFQDLQNVNPFEETFRRAVEAGKTGTLAAPEAGISDDTLHTPHIFPHIVDVQSNNNQDLLENGVSEPPVISLTDSSDEEAKNPASLVRSNVTNRSEKEIKTVELDTVSQDGSIVETIVVQEADTSISTTVLNLTNSYQQNSAPQLSINGKEVQLLIKTEDGNLMQLSAIPVSQSQSNPTTVNVRSNTQTVVIKTEPSLNYSEKKRVVKTTSSKLSLAKMKLKQVLKKNGVTAENQEEAESPPALCRDGNNGGNQVFDVTKKQDILERNRASSMRARAKRKAWIQQLERSVYNVNEANAVLQLEVLALRSEVAKLKTLLLAHKDCPVSKAMEQGNSIVLGPKVISLSADMIQSAPPAVTSTAVSAVKRTSVVSTEVVGVLPKKKPSVSSASTNPVILPKSGIGGSVLPIIQKGKIVRNLSSIKLVDVEQVVNKRERMGKQILIVQSQGRKGVGNQRQIIRLNPNFELENDASKSTGS